MMPPGVELYIECELGANAYKIVAYKYGIFAGWLIGYIDYRSKVVNIYPYKKIIRGTFGSKDFPIVCRIDELPWKKRKEG